MSLEVLASMVVVGIALVIGAVNYFGMSHSARIDDESGIRRRLGDDFPEVMLRDAVITADRTTAFFRCSDGRVAIARAMGSRFVTRLLGAASVRRLDNDKGTELTLELDDFTFPRMRLGFASPDDARRVSNWLETKDHA